MEQPAQHLLPVELLPPAVFFDDHVWDLINPLVGREPLVAALALTPPADRVRLFAFARINHSILGKTAVGTFHGATSILSAPYLLFAGAQIRPAVRRPRSPPSRPRCCVWRNSVPAIPSPAGWRETHRARLHDRAGKTLP